MAIRDEDINLPRKLFMERGGFTSSDLTGFLKKHGINSYGHEGIPVFAVMDALNKERKKRQHGEGTDIEKELKNEKLQEARLKNQKEMGLWMMRRDAKERMKTTLFALANKIKYLHKQIAPRVAISSNAMECENICVSEYNKILQYLKREAKNVSWEDDGVKTKLGRTELVGDSGESTSIGDDKGNASPVEG